jgi:hypothetical protein
MTHRKDSDLAIAIRNARTEVREGRTGNLINARIALGNLALWNRGRAMRAWTYDQATGAMGSYQQFERRLASRDRCPGSREDSNYFEWLVTDRDLNLFGQCISCGRDIPLLTNRWGYYILAEHEGK